MGAGLFWYVTAAMCGCSRDGDAGPGRTADRTGQADADAVHTSRGVLGEESGEFLMK